MKSRSTRGPVCQTRALFEREHALAVSLLQSVSTDSSKVSFPGQYVTNINEQFEKFSRGLFMMQDLTTKGLVSMPCILRERYEN